MSKKNPIQPIVKDKKGVPRFKENKIVMYLLDNGGIDLNELATKKFSVEDQEQFAQLIGYSLSGFGELSYVTDETFNAANNMYTNGSSESDARIDALETSLEAIKDGLRVAAVEAFNIHEDDLK